MTSYFLCRDDIMSSVPRSLFELLVGYAALSPPLTLSFPPDVTPIQAHDFIIEHILLNHRLQAYPPSRQYQRTFWKWAIQKLEEVLEHEDFDIDPRIFDHYLELMPSSGPALGSTNPNLMTQLCPRGLPLGAPPSKSFITHYWTVAEDRTHEHQGVDLTTYKTTTLLESRTMIESGTTGLRTWLASLVLARHLVNNPALVLGQRILELGSGVGYLGIIVSSLQVLHGSTSPIWLTDVNDTVLTRCDENIKLQGNLSSAHPNVKTQHIDWSAALDTDQLPSLQSLLTNEINADLILGADIVFDPSLIPALVATLELALSVNSNSGPLVTCFPEGPSANATDGDGGDGDVHEHDHAAARTPNINVGLSKKRTALIALTVRNPGTISSFIRQAEERLNVSELDVEPQVGPYWGHEAVDGGGQGVKLFSISAKDSSI